MKINEYSYFVKLMQGVSQTNYAFQ